MSDLLIRAGSHTEKGVRERNEDSCFADEQERVFLVADGMGGQADGDRASAMAAEIIPKSLHAQLHQHQPYQAVRKALAEANDAIVREGERQPEGRRMGTTAVLAFELDEKIYVANVGDSRAYLIRSEQVDQLTTDHSVAQALVSCGAMTPEEAANSRYQHILHKYLGCAEMQDDADVQSFTPRHGDRLLLASDGLTNYLGDDDLVGTVRSEDDPTKLAKRLVTMALERGSNDNVTCVVVAFDAPA